jgi:hypothetical protein
MLLYTNYIFNGYKVRLYWTSFWLTEYKGFYWTIDFTEQVRSRGEVEHEFCKTTSMRQYKSEYYNVLFYYSIRNLT